MNPDDRSPVASRVSFWANCPATAWFMGRLVTFGQPYWPDHKWDIPVPPIAVKSGFTWEADGVLDLDARGIAFYSFFAPPTKLGAGQSYLVTFVDAKGRRLHGGDTYDMPGEEKRAQV